MNVTSNQIDLKVIKLYKLAVLSLRTFEGGEFCDNSRIFFLISAHRDTLRVLIICRNYTDD